MYGMEFTSIKTRSHSKQAIVTELTLFLVYRDKIAQQDMNGNSPELQRLRLAFGNERDGFSEDDQQKSLIWTYLGRSALVSETDSNLLLNSASYLRNPAFTEYQACVFGNVRLVIHDCPLWDIFESDWYTSRNLIGEADIIVIKYSVNDKSSFQEVKDIYAPLIKKTLSHCSVPVIISAVGARQNGAFQWDLLEEHIKKKLKNPGNVELVLERVNGSQNYRTYLSKRPLHLCNSSLRLFFNTTVLADVMFKIQGATVPAHKAVLVARCEVMAAMFNGNYIESNSFLVPVYGISKDTFLSFLEYLYTDSCCPASILQAMSLLICAEMYQVSRLQHICELYIITQLQSMPSRELTSTSLSVVTLLQKAKFHNSDCLSNWLLHFIASNYLIFSQKPEFEDLSGMSFSSNTKDVVEAESFGPTHSVDIFQHCHVIQCPQRSQK
ncbi:Rho-related BTB domain-containing protein 3, partial [Ophiophagus hannah]